MHEPLSFAEAAARARVMATALALGRSLDLCSLALVVLALAGLLWVALPLTTSIGLLLSILAAFMQKVFALRVAFDAALFCHWAEAWDRDSTQGRDSIALEADLRIFDQALVACGLGKTRGNAARDLCSRLHGAVRLLRRQALALAIQFSALAVAMAAMLLSGAG